MYSAREVAHVLGVSAHRLRSYLRSGFVAPTRTDRGKLEFSFQDLVLMRKAEGLVTARIPPRRVHAALRSLRHRMPDGAALSRVQLATVGAEILVDDGRTRWDARSGQLVLDFDRAAAAGPGATVTSIADARTGSDAASAREDTRSARELYDDACALESTSREGAATLYRRALDADPHLADAHVNLGRLVHEAGDVGGALAHYRAALALRPGDSVAAFNLGVALEDRGAVPEALDAYHEAVACDPDNADAHYNLARLYEQSGRPALAIRHLSAYRKLTRQR